MARKSVGYAVVGLGHIAQAAALPAFAKAKRARLVALVSSDEEKLQALGDHYQVQHRFSYDDFEQCLALDEVQAVYIALPNDKHLDFTERAAAAGRHVLCEKPMEVSTERSVRMVEACEAAGVKLMIAYRLHFEPGNLDAVKRAQAGELGDLRFFSSEFSFQVREDNIRTQHERGGGVVWDIGVYCVNGARYLFRDEPEELFAFASTGSDRRFAEVEESVGCMMRFPQGRMATFTVSFGAAATSSFRLVGTRGDLRLDNAYDWAGGKKLELTVDEETRTRRFKAVDQFAGELDAFARCVQENREPEPNGREGLIDVKIVEAIYQSIQTGRPVRLDDLPRRSRRPDEDMAYRLPAQKEAPELVGVESPSQ